MNSHIPASDRSDIDELLTALEREGWVVREYHVSADANELQVHLDVVRYD